MKYAEQSFAQSSKEFVVGVSCCPDWTTAGAPGPAGWLSTNAHLTVHAHLISMHACSHAAGTACRASWRHCQSLRPIHQAAYNSCKQHA